MKIPIFYIVFFLWSITAFGQDNFAGLTPKFSMGVHRLGLFTEASLGIKIYENTRGLLNFQSCFVILGLEHNYYFRKDFRLAPKIGIEYNDNIFTVRLQNRLYPNKNLDFKQASWQVCPEVGINIFNVVSFTYGYNIPITHRAVIPSLGHQLSLNFNLPSGL